MDWLVTLYELIGCLENEKQKNEQRRQDEINDQIIFSDEYD